MSHNFLFVFFFNFSFIFLLFFVFSWKIIFSFHLTGYYFVNNFFCCIWWYMILHGSVCLSEYACIYSCVGTSPGTCTCYCYTFKRIEYRKFIERQKKLYSLKFYVCSYWYIKMKKTLFIIYTLIAVLEVRSFVSTILEYKSF